MVSNRGACRKRKVAGQFRLWCRSPGRKDHKEKGHEEKGRKKKNDSLPSRSVRAFLCGLAG
jgi:hypothetical protein